MILFSVVTVGLEPTVSLRFACSVKFAIGVLLRCRSHDLLVANACDRKATEAQVEQLLTWAEKYDEASYEPKHLIIAALVDRVEVNKNYEVKVFFKVSAEQFLGRVVRIA